MGVRVPLPHHSIRPLRGLPRGKPYISRAVESSGAIPSELLKPRESRDAHLPNLPCSTQTTMPRRRMPWVYVLRCSDESLYVGVTTNLVARVQQHQDGDGGSYTSKRRPARLVYSEKISRMTDAIERERQLKRWSTQKKLALISGDLGVLRSLARRRQPKKTV